MTFPARMMFILAVTLALFGRVASAQETETTATTATTAAESTGTAAATDTAATDTTATSTDTTTTADGETAATPAPRGAYEVRTAFTRMLQQHPYDVRTVLALDPSLLTNDQFVSGYPEIARFLSEHPEIRRNPRYYVAEFYRPEQQSAVEEILEMLAALTGVGMAVFAFGWFIRTLVEQRRWNRLSRTQAEVHNKILDRFGTSNELLEYMRTPAGTKFLESAPIPLHVEKPVQNTPMTRIMWSIQIGVIVAIAAVGMLLVSFRFDDEGADSLFALGVIALCIGGGFVASAFVSLALSRRLGMWRGGNESPGPTFDEPGSVR